MEAVAELKTAEAAAVVVNLEAAAGRDAEVVAVVEKLEVAAAVRAAAVPPR